MKEIKKALDRKISNLRITMTGIITSVKKNNTIFAKVSDSEELRDIKIVSPYGIYSLPLNGQYGHLLANNSSRNPILVGIEHTEMPISIEVGEVLLYNQIGENYIHLKNDGKIIIKGTDIELQGNSIKANGEDLTIDNI